MVDGMGGEDSGNSVYYIMYSMRISLYLYAGVAHEWEQVKDEVSGLPEPVVGLAAVAFEAVVVLYIHQ